MSKEEFIKELEKLGININEKQLTQLEEYYDLIIDYNKHTNLTRITDKEEVYLKHYYDSITLIKAVKLNDQTLLDVGSGAGFPGIVLKIVFPQLKITLLDSLNKRITFLNEVIEKLELKNISAVHARAEEYALINKEKYDIITSRAVASLRILSEMCIPMLKINGCFIAMKSEVEEEKQEATSTIKTLGSVIENIIEFNLVENDLKRNLVIIKKISKTSDKYPRKFSEIKKKPL